jgi:mono/diheme cytochrome c family protein
MLIPADCPPEFAPTAEGRLPMPKSVCSCLAWLGMLLSAPAASAARPVVAGFERFYAADKTGTAAGGRLLLSELNCISCHSPTDASVSRKPAPVLDQVGSRIRVSYLRRYLADPQAAKPGTTMPHLLSGDPDAKGKIEALVHFLASTGSPRQERPMPREISAGRDLYHKVGCVACHGTRNAAGEQAKAQATSVPLGDVKAKYTLSSLAAFLEHPHVVRPGGRMPKLLANSQEARSVAGYLLAGAKIVAIGGKGAVKYSYYEGEWDRLPDFSKLKPAAIGTVPGFDLAAARRDSNYAMKFDAFLKIDREATYSFSLMSDDGSKLIIDDKTVIDNDGVHAPTTKRGRIKLTKGIHKVTVAFFQVGGGAELEVRMGAPGIGRINLDDLVATSADDFDRKPKPRSDDLDALEIQPALVARGKGLFASLGCANCHTLRDGDRPIAAMGTASPLAKLHGDAGCLAATPGKGLPVYGLDDVQRKALAAALKAPAPAKNPGEFITVTLTTFNCYACHVRDKLGGPEEEINKQFTTTQPEMGDEARLPPPLDGVGAKLKPDYFKQILDQGAHDRPYMLTRMPGFALANVGHLVDALAGVDRLKPFPEVKFAEPAKKIKATARHLVGAQAFGCIKCHTFAGQKAEGVQGIDMVLMPRRVRRDWFHAYVSDPQTIRPGTRMPAAFIEGKSVLPTFLDGTAAQQIEAIWLYLLDGNKAQMPVGVGRSFIPLEPTNSAILYRNFITGAGTRAIGVGYPEKAHLAFDANEMRLALLWQGAFIDAARHWTDRGAGSEGPLGDNILTLHHGAGFAVLDKPDEVWPTAAPKKIGYHFLGYKLTTDDRPTFRYSFAGIKVEDFPNPFASGKDVHLLRTLTLTTEKAPANLCFRAAVGNKIAEKDGWYRIDDTWRLKLPPGVKARIRKSAGKSELLVPVTFTDGKAQLVFEYAW